MADTAVLRVDVASADFDKFKTTFDQYAKTLQDTLATWQKITNEVKAASVVMTNMAAPVARSTASLQKFTQQFSETAKHAQSIRTNVDSISKGLVSWRTAMGSTMALLGMGGGLWGLTSLVTSLSSDRARALATGVGYGQFRGMNAGMFPGAGAAMEGWGTARYDITSGAHRGAQVLYGEGTDRQLARTDPLAMVDALNKATEYLKQFPPSIRDVIAANTGLTDFLGKDALRTWQNLTKDEVAVRTRAIKAAGDAAEAAEKSVQKWTTFNIALESSKSVIQDVLIDKLAPLAGPLTDLTTGMNAAVKAFLEAPVVQQAITDMAKAVQGWADYLNSPDGKKGIQEFASELKNAYDQVKAFADSMVNILNTIVSWENKISAAGSLNLSNIHTGPATESDVKRNLDLGYDRHGAKINPDGSSANFPNPGEATAAAKDPTIAPTPWYKQKGFGFGWSNKSPATPGNASATPGPSVIGSTADSGTAEWMKKWFMEESQATKKAADSAEKRDNQLTKLLEWLRTPHMVNGQPEMLKTRSLADSHYMDAAKQLLTSGGVLPPAARGAWSFLRSTPAETGELPASLFPGTPGAAAAGSWGGGAGDTMRGRGGAAGSIGAPGRTVASGTLAGNQAEAYQAARSAGLSDNAARALVANFSGESLRDPGNTSGDSGQAQGIGQWHPDRARAIAAHFGKMPSQMSVAEQTKAAIWEMQTNPTYKQSWSALQGGGSSESMVGTLVGNYERPANVGAATAQRERFLHGLPSQFGGKGPAGPASSSVSEIKGPDGSSAPDATALLAEVKKTHPHFTNEQCVTLVREYCGMGGTVRDWRKGQNVMGGGMKIGQPIATFMSSRGQQSERYDAGGIGTPGAGTSHAALFGGYSRDKQGNITGINVVEQYKGSHGPHTQHYGVGGYGEHGAENYFGIAAAGQQKSKQSLNGLDNDNWQLKPVHNVAINNKTGSDVNIAASTVMASA